MVKKQPTNFRLSTENIQMVSEFSKQFGMDKTEFLEFVLTLIRKNPDLFLKSFERSLNEVVNRLGSDSV
jgi:hypothetical protein